ncbi:unnamed protein product, partial [Protopolystoma xenopodis]
MKDIVNWSHAIIVLFSITSRRSFYRAQELVETMQSLLGPKRSCGAPAGTQGHSGFGHTGWSGFGGGSGSFGGGGSPGQGTSGGIIGGAGFLSSDSSTGLTMHNLFLSPGSTGSLRRGMTSGTWKPILVQRGEIEKLAEEFQTCLFEITVSESFKLVEELFHSVVRQCLGNRHTTSATSPLGNASGASTSLGANTGNSNSSPSSSGGFASIPFGGSTTTFAISAAGRLTRGLGAALASVGPNVSSSGSGCIGATTTLSASSPAGPLLLPTTTALSSVPFGSATLSTGTGVSASLLPTASTAVSSNLTSTSSSGKSGTLFPQTGLSGNP